MQTKDVVKRSVLYILGPMARVARSTTYLFIQGMISIVIGVAVWLDRVAAAE